ncbi:MAG: hypothetical protein WCH99_09675 [Verrucomicrobiota bacterium]
MSRLAAKPILAAGVVLLFLVSGHGQVHVLPVGRATDFTSDSYYDAPHEQQVKVRLSGAEAAPLPGGLLDVKKMKIEMFNVSGRLEMLVRAPQCTYAPQDGVAGSAGHLELQSGDGRFRVEGDGFLWRQGDSTLIISNRVHTVIKSGTFNLSAS